MSFLLFIKNQHVIKSKTIKTSKRRRGAEFCEVVFKDNKGADEVVFILFYFGFS